jgi:mono/diheme cytochrome c family protein
MKAALRAALLLLTLVVLVAGAVVYGVTARGLSTRVAPSALEARLAQVLRWLATPREVRDRSNPVAPTEAVLDDALIHFADHCASCHANDGSGDTAIGRSLYPRAPDMRAARTQGLTDGELFSIIENGIRLTGMPAWGTGTPAGEAASWGLVHFIRRLPRLTADDLARMQEFNPKSPQQFRDEEAARRFLAGDDDAVPGGSEAPHPGGHP